MWLNGQMIQGLVTEDHRTDWEILSLEEMYDRVVAELDRMSYRQLTRYNTDLDPIRTTARKIYQYQVIDEPSDFDTVAELRDYFEQVSKDPRANKDLLQHFFNIIDSLEQIETDQNTGYTQTDLEQMLFTINKSKATEKLDIISPPTGKVLVTVYTPEEKKLAAEVLNIIRGNTAYPQDYKKWYDEVQRTLGADPDIDEVALQQILDAIV